MNGPTDARQKISLIVPIYNESAVIDEFYRRASDALEAIEGMDYEIVFIDDGSRDDSYQQLAALAEQDSRIRVLKFSRNFGHQIAITAGLDYTTGDCIAIIDADLQDPPEVVAEMVAKWHEGYDVIYGKREEREGETFVKLVTAKVFYRLLAKMVRIEIPTDVGDFRLMSRRAAEQLMRMREKDRYVRGLVSWIGFKQTGVMYRRDKRYAGETKYPLRKMLKFALDGITSFSTVPLKLATWLGYFASFVGFLYLSTVFVQKAMGITVPGFATIVVSVLFMGGVQLICLGIIGEYIGRIFNEIKPRPMYIVEQCLNPAEGRPERSD